jgi:hypothetical protein
VPALFPRLHRAAWAKARAKRKYRPLEDELLWHQVYEQYINSLPPVELGARRDELIERHLHILGPIAGQIAWKRCPKSCGVWSKEAAPHLSHVGLVYELAAFGVFGLLIAADRYKPDSGWAFSTYANYWIKKFIRLYLDEIIGIVPRTGHMGPDPSTFCINEDGEECWVDFPRRSVMDLVDAALNGARLYRGKASGGMPIFDSGLTIPGPNPGDKEIEVVGSDGPTDPTRLDYLQRRVTKKLYPWVDIGTHFTPRLELPGHPGGKASEEEPQEDSYELDPLDLIEFKGKRDATHLGSTSTIPFLHLPHEVCYLATQRRDRIFNSRDKFGEKTYAKPKTVTMRDAPHWHNSLPFAVDYLRRHRRPTRVWRKPSIQEAVWCDLAA